MTAGKFTREDDYLRHLRTHPKEIQILVEDFLIPVTEFFRDQAVFRSLEKGFLRSLARGGAPSDPIRIWVPACSSGEEVYSLAILMAELTQKSGTRRRVQLFGTDVNDAAVERARLGIYSSDIRRQVSAKRLQQFFELSLGGYRIRKSVRDMCVFARHDVVADPPFSNLDLISCRNLLIYFTAELQKKIIPAFYFALKPTGGLLLGSAETAVDFPDLFVLKDKAARFYLRNRSTPNRPRKARDPTQLAPPTSRLQGLSRTGQLAKIPQLRAAAERLLQRYIGTVKSSSATEQTPREKGGQSVPRSGMVPGKIGGGAGKPNPKDTENASLPADRRFQKELSAIREALQPLLAQTEATHEELRAANEEIVSSNEELQSTNEELEDTKEKLQSAVEELASVNAELTRRNADLEMANLISSRFAAIVTSSDDAIISKDLNGVIQTWNQGAEKIFGYTAQEVIGKPISILIPEDRIDEEPGILARLRRGERIDHYETIRRRKDATLLNISLSVSPVKNSAGVVVGAAKIARDITALKRAESELKRARDEAERANRAKDQFLAALSHELRTPLNPVLLLASEAAADSSLPAKAREDFELIRHNIELEAQLIDDLLDLSRITAGKLRLDKRPVDPHEILLSTIRMVRSEMDQKGIELTERFSSEKGLVAGDTIRLHQIFWNVLKNAVKFTPAKGRICVETSISEKSFIAVISDTGIGMTEAELARAFDAFKQGSHAEDVRQHFGGLGLGLTISRKLVEAQDGRIEASSKGRNWGASFRIEFPLAGTSERLDSQESGPATSEVPETTKQPARILLVEDHGPTRNVLARILSGRGHEVAVAASVREALEAASAGRFDVVISDIGLPDGSGYDLFNEIRKHLPAIKGVALTGYGMEEDLADARKRGFNLHLTKPIRIQALDQALAEILGA